MHGAEAFFFTKKLKFEHLTHHRLMYTVNLNIENNIIAILKYNSILILAITRVNTKISFILKLQHINQSLIIIKIEWPFS